MVRHLVRRGKQPQNCAKCGDILRGHEDENGTHCRFCVTYTDAVEGMPNSQITEPSSDNKPK